MNPSTVFFVGSIPAFLAGFGIGSMYEKRKRMKSPAQEANRLFAWFAQGNRLVGLVVVAAALAVLALVYTFTSNKSGQTRDEHNLDCVVKFVQLQTTNQQPRTRASVAASDARRDWDRGYSESNPKMTKAALKARYLVLYAQYEDAREDNPILPPIRDFCGGL